MKWYADKINSENNGLITRALVITLSGNVFLAVIKALTASFNGSSALWADALNSISDVLYSVTLVVGLYISIKPADMSHPQGHRRFEPLMGLVIGLSMAWAGYQAVHGAIDKIVAGPQKFDLGWTVLVLFFSMLVKIVMFILIRKIALKVSSPTLKTASIDNLLDTMTSGMAIIGVTLSHFVFPLADPIAGILVAMWIFKAAFSALKENLGYLTGSGVEELRLIEMRDAVLSVPGVLNVHQLFAEHVGTKILVEMHVNASGNTTLSELHWIETEIERRISEFENVERSYIHIEPPEFK